MTRITLAIATALFASTLLLTPAAQACISCNYTPEVVNTPHPNAKRQQKRGQAAKKQQRVPAAAKSQAARKGQPAKAAKKAPEPKAAIAKAEPVENEAGNSQAEATEAGPRLTGSSALMQQSIPRQEEAAPVAAADAEAACKKFIPAVGATVSVPCD